jgi:hypothetical protein
MHIPADAAIRDAGNYNAEPMPSATAVAARPDSHAIRSPSPARRLGLVGLRQTGPMIAQALSQEIETFNELLAFLEQVWKVSGVSRVPMPPWEDRLL